MIELRNVTKYYPVQDGYRYILRNVSVTIPDRVNLAVLGPNGAGKSTFLRIIGGAEPANSGTIITNAEISWPLGLTTGFQGSFSARENVRFICQINGLSPEHTAEVIQRVIDFAELGEYFDMPMRTYSSGMRGRVSFGLSMAFQFDVYLIDEQTSVGDSIFREKAKAAFERIRKKESLIYVSHNLKTLRASCQTALFLRDGKADFFVDIDEGIDAYNEYMSERRNHGQVKTRKQRRKMRRRRMRRRERRDSAEQSDDDPE